MSGRLPKSVTVENEVPVEVEQESKITLVRSEVESVFESAPEIHEPDPLRPDQDLSAEQRAEFAKLLQKEMPLKVRAKQLVKLAMFSDTKRAPVGLRAIQVINEITGVTDTASDEAPSMFNLPEGVSVEVKVKTPEK